VKFIRRSECGFFVEDRRRRSSGDTRFLERKHETLRVSGKELYTAAAGWFGLYGCKSNDFSHTPPKNSSFFSFYIISAAPNGYNSRKVFAELFSKSDRILQTPPPHSPHPYNIHNRNRYIYAKIIKITLYFLIIRWYNSMVRFFRYGGICG